MVVSLEKPQLNSQQSEAVQKLTQWLEDGIRIVGLYGTAGTGKTFAASEILRNLHGKILVVAPTNTAVKQLKRSLAKGDRTYECMTVAKALGQIPDIGEEGETIFQTNADMERDDLENVDFLMIDEASMLARKNLEELLGRIRPHCKVLILMDIYQLPPVGEKTVYASELVGTNFYQLTKTERYREDSHIYQVINAAREAVISKNSRFNPLIKFPNSVLDNPRTRAGYYVKSESEALPSLIRAVKEQRNRRQWDFVRCICWTNKEVARINDFVRYGLYPGWAENQSYIPGEILITTGAVQRVDRDRTVVMYPTSTNLIVLDTKDVPVWDRDEEEFTIWRTIVEDPDEDGSFKKREVNLIDHRDRDRYYAKLERLRQGMVIASKESGYKSIPWKKAYGYYQQFSEIVDPIRHSYAITAHGAQGASLNLSYLNVSNIMTNRMDVDVRLRCLFVGASRARDSVLVF